MRALVTGVNGFIGSYLPDFLAGKKMEVFGTIREHGMGGMEHAKDKIKLIKCDMRSLPEVKNAVKEVCPDIIYHLAAQSRPDVSWIDPVGTMDINLMGTVYLFEAVRQLELDPKILVPGSSAEYGLIKKEEPPIKEDHPLLPVSPYGVSKVAQNLLAYQYFKNYGMKTVRVRIFGATGPRKVGDACSDFCKQIIRIKRGAEPVIHVGNLDVVRDLMDINDTLDAFWVLLEKEKYGDVYNVCSSKPLRIGDMLDKLLMISGVKARIEMDPKKLRPTDEPVVVGDNTKISKECGWAPKIPFEKTLADTLDYWVKVEKERAV
ncbi:MAG: GDP-mannose 4,6-dehydratase [Candidatus Hadarchaeota archaeon]